MSNLRIFRRNTCALLKINQSIIAIRFKSSKNGTSCHRFDGQGVTIKFGWILSEKASFVFREITLNYDFTECILCINSSRRNLRGIIIYKNRYALIYTCYLVHLNLSEVNRNEFWKPRYRKRVNETFVGKRFRKTFKEETFIHKKKSTLCSLRNKLDIIKKFVQLLDKFNVSRFNNNAQTDNSRSKSQNL